MVDDSFIVTRDDAGAIHVMFNMCLHRGMQVCRAERGNASHFRCPYHAWTYRNDGRLAGVPFHEEAYGGDDGFGKEGQALLAAPHAGDPQRAGLRQPRPGRAAARASTLGDFALLPRLLHRPRARPGWSCAGPQRWRIKANWKIGAENFAGDSYHTPHTHASVVDIGLFREPKANKRKEGALYLAGPGARHDVQAAAGRRRSRDQTPLRRLPPGRDDPRMAAGLDDRQRALVADSGFMPSAATLFPNLSFVHNWPQVDDGRDRRAVHLAAPVAAGQRRARPRCLSWFAVDADAPDDVQAPSRTRAYLMCFGSSGMFEQDDVENWVSITDMAAGVDGPAADS